MTTRFDYRPPTQFRTRASLHTYWTLQGEGHTARAQLFAHPLGFEIEIHSDGEMQRTQVHRSREKADEDARATQERLETRGWRPSCQPHAT